MLIGIDASRANKSQKTGTEWYSYYLIQELKKIDHKNRFILYSDNPLKGDLGKLPFNWQNKVLKWPLKFFWTQLRFSWEMLVGSSDLLFVPAHAIPIIHPKRVITTIHDLGFERFPEAYLFWQRFYLRWSTSFALKHAEKIIVPSEFTKRELIDLYEVDTNKIVVIYHGYDEKIYQVLSRDTEQMANNTKHIIHNNLPYFLYIGRLEKKKNISNLIKAFKILKSYKPKNYKLLLVGPPGFGYQEIKKELKDAKDIIQLNWIGPKDLPYFLNAASLFIFPSFYEGFGLPVIEAMACGIPVIASQAGSLPEIAGNASLLVEPTKPEEIAKAIKKILEDENLRKELRTKGFERAKNFSWSKCAIETLKLLQSS